MNNLDSMLKRSKDFAARQTAAGTLMPSLPRAMPNVQSNHHRLRRYACGSCSCTWH
jgi:hypothetical protein